MFKRVSAFIASMLVGTTAAAQPEPVTWPPDVAALLEPIRVKRGVPAIGGAIIVGEEVVASGVTGIRASGHDAPVTIDDRFHLGSCTKAMTALLLATLVEDGVLSWETTIGESLPAITMHEQWKSVTLRQLITHRAGAPADLNRGGLWRRLWDHTGTPTEQRRDLAIGVLAERPVHAPGTKYLYSNAGYAIAGYIAETKTGTSWEDLMRQRIFVPLGMTSAGFGPPGSPGNPPDQPRGHARPNRPTEPAKGADNPAAIGPAGTVHAAIKDWAAYIAVHLRGDAANPNRVPRLVSAASFDLLHEPADGPGERYAGGWLVDTRPWARGEGAAAKGKVLTHAGSNTMWFAVVWIAPERDFAVLAVCNQGDAAAPRACDEAVGALIQAMRAKPGSP